MNTRTMTMYSNDFGINQGRASPLLRVTKPASHLADAVAALIDAVGEAVEFTAGATIEWYRRRRAYAEMARLDDHLLRDIGLSRESLMNGVPRRRTGDRRY